MKRCLTSLVDYEISDDEDDSLEVAPKPPLVKKRKLPPISSSLLPATPIDNPALHQGRIRTAPHVEGQFAAHVYVPLKVSKHTRLYKLIAEVIENTKETVPTIHEIWPVDTSSHIELHVSLSRPIYLRAHQREDLKRAVKEISKNAKKFSLSFATFSELTNDEKSRTFLTMEVGAGHHELKSLCNSLTPTLHAIRQKEFYTEPRFHASIAWALLERSVEQDISSIISYSNSQPTLHTDDTDPSVTDDGLKFLTIPHFPQHLIPNLNERFCSSLPVVSTFDVEKITVKIGKEITSWLLAVQ